MSADPFAFARLAEARRWKIVELYGLDDPRDSKPADQRDGKRPIGRAWQGKGMLAAVGRFKSLRERGSNVGLLPGASLLAVLDVEPAGLATWPPERFPAGALLIRTPSLGLHVPIVLEAAELALGFEVRHLHAPGAELIGRVGQVVVPPSRARSRKVRDPVTGRYDAVRVGQYAIEQMGEPIDDVELLRELLAPFRAQAVHRNGSARRKPMLPAVAAYTTTYGRAALEREMVRIAAAPTGQRHATFVSGASKVYSLVAGGEIEEREGEESLRAAFTTAQPERVDDMDRCLADARTYGFARPRSAPRSLEPQVEHARESEPASAVPPEGETKADPETAEGVQAPATNQAAGHAPDSPPKTPRGSVVVADGQLHEVVAELELVLARTGLIYRRGSLLVIPSRVEQEVHGRPRRSLGALHAPRATEPALVELAMRHAQFVRLDKRTETGWRATDLPEKYARTLISRADDRRRLPELLGLAEAPILRPDGTVAIANGYDRDSGYMLGLSIDFPPIPERPTREEAERALARLKEPLAEFPFTSEAARSVALSSLLVLLARPAMRTVPGHAFDAPTMGSGKTLLADLPALLATGRCAAANQVPEGEEELRKLLLALAIEGDPLLVLDNVEETLRSGALSAAMTAETIRGRVLGVSATATAPWSACVFVTGNNVSLAGDVSARFLRCRIDARVELPEERDAFKIADLRAWVLDHRAALVGAALTVLRWGALLAERPKLSRFGRFEDYDRIVRAPLVGLGCADPGDTRTQLRTEDSAREERVELLTSLRAHFGEAEFTAEEAVQKTNPAACSAERAKATHALGYQLREARDKVTAGLLLVRIGEGHAGKVRWLVSDAAYRPEAMEATGGHVPTQDHSPFSVPPSRNTDSRGPRVGNEHDLQ